MTEQVGKFIGGVGALVRDPVTQKYLLLRRSAQKDVGAGSWECVTGRVDQGESFEDAVLREVREEIGVDFKLEFLVGTTHFYRGAELAENELLGVLYSGTISDPGAVQIGPEHDRLEWMSKQEIAAFLPESHWLRWLIGRAEAMRAATSADLIDLYASLGFQAEGPGKLA